MSACSSASEEEDLLAQLQIRERVVKLAAVCDKLQGLSTATKPSTACIRTDCSTAAPGTTHIEPLELSGPSLNESAPERVAFLGEADAEGPPSPSRLAGCTDHVNGQKLEVGARFSWKVVGAVVQPGKGFFKL